MEKTIKEVLTYVEKSRGISEDVLLKAIEEALAEAYKKRLGVKNTRVSFGKDKESIQVFIIKEVTESVEKPKEQISLEDARNIKKEVNIGDTIEIKVVENPSLTRISLQIAKQVITHRIREAEKNSIFQEFIPKKGDIITGTIRKIGDNVIFVDVGKTEGILPKKEQVKREKYRIGERIKTYIVGVEQKLNYPQIILSRTHPNLVKRLFETEVPEFQEGSVKIERMAREPGIRSKVIVSSTDKSISGVGAFVGTNASRISSLLKELHGEKVDIIPYSEDINKFIGASILPAKAEETIVDEKKKEAVIIVNKDQLSLAIGSNGQNIRLAAKLCGFKLDVRTREQYLEEKSQEDKRDVIEEQ